MSGIQFTVAKGRCCELAKRVIDGDPSTSDMFIALYKTVEANSALLARTTKTLVDANNTECDFTTYVANGKSLVNLNYSTDVAGKGIVDADDLKWAAAGGVTNNDIAKAILFYVADTATMGDAVPMAVYNMGDITTKGVDLDLVIPASGLTIN